jgi:hypothetical protein
LIPRPNFDRLGGIATRKAIKDIPQLGQHESGHVVDATHQHPWCFLIIDGNDALTDVLCEIAYALDLVGNSQDPNNLAKVIGYRLTPGNGLDCSFLNIALHDVDRRIGGNYALRATAVARHQCLDRLGNLALGQSSHLRGCPREFLQVCIEDFGGMSHCAAIDPSCATRRERPFYDDSMSAR